MSSTRDQFRAEYSIITAEVNLKPFDLGVRLERASFFEKHDYHDLAAGEYYKALILTDDALDEAGEYRQSIIDGADPHLDGESRDAYFQHRALDCYNGLATCLLELGCIRSAYKLCQRGLTSHAEFMNNARYAPTGLKVQHLHQIKQTILGRSEISDITIQELNHEMIDNLPDKGWARRELYPWDDHEPDRYSEESLRLLNEQLQSVAPKCLVKAIELPNLHAGTKDKTATATDPRSTIKQLGLFAREKIDPGTVLLKEKSLLTVNNRLHDELCDACSTELMSDPLQSFACDACGTTIFCSQGCLDQAQKSYHPAVCDNENFEAINKDVPPSQATDALYGLLLGRAIAMAETQELHPLDLPEIRLLWGDYSPWESPTGGTATDSTEAVHRPRTLPWSFEQNIETPIHILNMLDINVFEDEQKYDFWVLNTLLAKFRGVANARMNPRTGKPEVAAVHPLWCLANHSCAPNVTWEWGGEIKMWARDGKNGEVVRWGPEKDDDSERWRGGLMAGEEVLNHYCDIGLPVNQRREWASGALGGMCMCDRCMWEAEHEDSEKSECQ